MKTDITHCLGNGCEVRDECLRYLESLRITSVGMSPMITSWMDTPDERPCPEKLEVENNDQTRD